MSEDDRGGSTKWLHDYLRPALTAIHRIDGVIHSSRSRYQSIEVIDTGSFGRCLVLDGKIQSGQRDEFIYHESLVHPALLAHPGPQRILIAGGGEGATLREVLRHRSVARVVMVDLDQQVVDVCRAFLPLLHGGAFDDNRCELHIDDARRYLEATEEKFDAIILDLPDPLSDGPARFLYTQEFYKLARLRLEESGVLALQAEPANWLDLHNFAIIVSTLGSLFRVVCPYCTHVPSFLSVWGFAIASDSIDPQALLSEEIDDRIRHRISTGLSFYDGLTHRALFSLPKNIRSALAATTRVASDAEPISAY